MNRFLTAAAGAALSLAVTTTGALAHAYPQTEFPAKGVTVKSAPATLWIEFDDELEPSFTAVAVTDAMGVSVEDGASHVSAKDSHHLSVNLKPLSPGKYTVTWHATDTDTHKTHGAYSFTVSP